MFKFFRKITGLLLFSSVVLFNWNCGEMDSNQIQSPKEIEEKDLLTPSYNCTLSVYQNANYTLKGEDDSNPVSVLVGQLNGNWTTTGQTTEWASFVTNPQTWDDDNGTFSTTSFTIFYNMNWVDGSCPYSTAFYDVGSGNPVSSIYFKTISSCPWYSGNITLQTNPASLLQTNSVYHARIRLVYYQEDLNSLN